ncbi:hypothetical protein B5E56_01030 [Flavonifractor sp. An112]|uniref:hypothetical protein n=1 Tax=Flavonifractor sp. An112 TaxID=1965544 RepID=UPI000B3A2F44|nr:hypothetical protein [Flavonifractor sp. An112]OUQ61882.1 hypothetical protein B5E56_01030 [Flavonifractor sp. An112]
MQTAKEKIEHIFRKGSGTFINRCYAIYSIIEEHGDNFGELLKYTFETNGFIESDNSTDAFLMISKSQEEELKNDYGDIVNGIIKALLKRNFETEVDYYEEYWKAINSAIFVSKESRVFALYYALIDKRLPYCVLESGVKMTNMEYRDRQEHLKAEITRMRFVIYNENLFEQNTETASILLKIINSVADEIDSVVLFSYLIDEIQKSSKLSSNSIHRLISALE